jgi:phage gp46-like protein
MPTYLVGSARPYTTIQSAFNAIPANLSGTGIHEVIIDAGIYNTGSTDFSLAKSNGSASDHVVIRAASGSEHFGFPNSGVRLSRSTNDVTGILGINSAYTQIINIVINNPRNGNPGNPNTRPNGIGFGSVGTNCTVRNVIVLTGTIGWCFSSSPFGATTYINCLALSRDQTVFPNYGFYLWNGDIVNNCGASRCEFGFNVANGSNATVYNSWARQTLGAGFYKEVISSWLSSSNNVSSDATAPGPNSKRNLSEENFSFNNPLANDFRITAASIIRSDGLDRSSLFTTDIKNQFINTWPIGPDSIYTIYKKSVLDYQGDAKLTFTGTEFDIQLDGNDLIRDKGLQTALMISLYTDSRDVEENDFGENALGYWADNTLGSGLWYLQRAKTLTETLSQAQDRANKALAWMLEDGVVSAVEAEATRIGTSTLRLNIALTKPNGESEHYVFQYFYNWLSQLRN